MTKLQKLPVRLLALSEAEENHRSHRLVKIKNCHSGKWDKKLIPSSLINDPRKLREFLTDAGLSLDISESDFKQIVDHLKGLPEDRVKLCMRPGFVKVDGFLCYLTGGGKVIGEYKGYAPMPHPDAKAFKYDETKKGTLKQWKINVAPSALHSPYIMLTVCSAMAGLVINFTDFEPGGFHLYGDSSKGKTTALVAAASIFGNDRYICDWNVTETAFEELAESRNNGLLILDELGLLEKNKKESAQRMQKLVYLLGSGRGKQRSVSYQKHTALWSLNAISNGESGLAQHASDGDVSRKKGEQVRLIDVPVDCENDLGIFINLPDKIRPSNYAEMIKENSQRYHGTAGPALIKKLVKNSSDVLEMIIDKNVQKFLVVHNVDGVNGFEKRLAKRFALAYASGVLAVKFKVLPFSYENVMEGISWCYMKARNKELLKKEMFTQLLKDSLINACKPTEEMWGSETIDEIEVIAHVIGSVKVLAVKADFFKENINGDLEQALDELRASGKLYLDSGKRSTRQIRKGKVVLPRRYCLIVSD